MPLRRNIGGYITANPAAPTTSKATGVWTLIQQLQSTAAGNWPAFVPDPNFENVTLLLPGNGTNGAQNNTFLDSSTNNFTVTRNGNTTQGSYSPYGDLWSNYFDGNGDYLSVPSNAAFSFGTSDFTIECWLYFTSYGSANQNILDFRGSAGSGSNIALYLENVGGTGTKQLRVYDGAGDAAATANNFPLNTWSHVAITRASNSFRFFVNGTQVGSTTTVTTNYSNTAGVYIGAYAGNIANFFGYLSNLRIVKGTALYTSNFTPPTAPLTAVAGTSLLTCQSNRFVDNSSNNFAITRNGDVRVTNFAPFNPTAAYSPAVNGGSGYFDGSGDYLSIASQSAFAFGTGDFTIEFWGYWNAVSSTTPGNVCHCVNNGTLGIYVTSTEIQLARYNTGGDLMAAVTQTVGQWDHYAISRQSGTARIFKNGVLLASGSVSTNYGQNGFQIGTGSGSAVNGYISNLRVVKGTAVYTSNFTPPTAPVTAISGTGLLLNFTNAGIVDASAKNDLETVGNAQISTAQSKFGGGSMAFDGSGDYLVSNSAAPDLYAFGSGDFTIEMWLNINASQTSGTAVFFDSRPSGTNGAYPCLYYSSGTIRYFVSTADRITSSSVSTGTWLHVAICRSGSSTKMFVNGTQAGSTYTDTTAYLNPAQRPLLGASGYSVSNDAFAGYIDDLRITKGVARYTANFTPPTAAFPLQ